MSLLQSWNISTKTFDVIIACKNAKKKKNWSYLPSNNLIKITEKMKQNGDVTNQIWNEQPLDIPLSDFDCVLRKKRKSLLASKYCVV